MFANTPEDVHRLFKQAFNAGDLDTLLTLYEPQAVLAPQPGQPVTGSTAIREALSGFLALNPTMEIQVRTAFTAGDIALLLSDWTLAGTAPDGAAVSMQGQTSDVVRRQADGRWLVVIDNPFGTQ